MGSESDMLYKQESKTICTRRAAAWFLGLFEVMRDGTMSEDA